MTNNLFFDNTRVSAFMRCPRYFYFRHVRHWERGKKRLPMGFGTCMHAAADVIWADAKSPITNEELTIKAYAAFLAKWNEEDLPVDLTAYSPNEFRAPGLGWEIIGAYIDTNRIYIQGLTLLAIEQPFAVPLGILGLAVYYIGRLDKVHRAPDGIWIDDHKTSSAYQEKGGPFQSSFTESFSPNNQASGYLYGGHLTYGNDFKGIYFDGILVNKTHRGFGRFPLMRRLEDLDTWRLEVCEWISLIITSAEDVEKAGVPRCYPKNPTSCSDWAGCTYRDICKYMNPDPALIIDTPTGFVEKKWEPFKTEDFENLAKVEEDK